MQSDYDIRNQIISFLSDEKPNLNVDLRDCDLFATGLMDSFRLFSLITFLEEKFAIRFDPADLNIENFKSVNNIAELVEDAQKTDQTK